MTFPLSDDEEVATSMAISAAVEAAKDAEDAEMEYQRMRLMSSPNSRNRQQQMRLIAAFSASSTASDKYDAVSSSSSPSDSKGSNVSPPARRATEIALADLSVVVPIAEFKRNSQSQSAGSQGAGALAAQLQQKLNNYRYTFPDKESRAFLREFYRAPLMRTKLAEHYTNCVNIVIAYCVDGSLCMGETALYLCMHSVWVYARVVDVEEELISLDYKLPENKCVV